jgi:endonuclease YncB( thermonuclease family)
MSRKVNYLFAAMFFSALVTSVFAWEGKVTSVIDGDTITILKDNGIITVRLYGIDCPESGQDFGSKATNFVTTMVNGKIVRVEDVDKDRYNRVSCQGISSRWFMH